MNLSGGHSNGAMGNARLLDAVRTGAIAIGILCINAVF